MMKTINIIFLVFYDGFKSGRMGWKGAKEFDMILAIYEGCN